MNPYISMDEVRVQIATETMTGKPVTIPATIPDVLEAIFNTPGGLDQMIEYMHKREALKEGPSWTGYHCQSCGKDCQSWGPGCENPRYRVIQYYEIRQPPAMALFATPFVVDDFEWEGWKDQDA